VKVHELPLGWRQSKGRAIVNCGRFRQGEDVRASADARLSEARYLFRTKNGIAEDRAEGVQHEPQGDGIIAIKMRDGTSRRRSNSSGDDESSCSKLGPGDPFNAQEARADGPRRLGVKGNAHARRRRGVISLKHRAGRRPICRRTEKGYGKAPPRTNTRGRAAVRMGGQDDPDDRVERGRFAGARVVREDGYKVMLIRPAGT